jgi:protein gp37
MGDKSAIEWTNSTWNPLTGCTKVSPGCDHCYMFRDYPRLAAYGVRGYAGGSPDKVRFWPERLSQPEMWRKPRMIFVNSMSDTFHSDVPDEDIDLIFRAMLNAPQHTYQMLTKRPNRVKRWWARFNPVPHAPYWPRNIWLGTSVEASRWDGRIERIAETPAPIKFLSAEPLLGPLRLEWCFLRGMLDWVIVGGESGPKARPMSHHWVRDIRDQCVKAGVPFFFKQWGGLRPKSNGRLLDGREWNEMPSVAAAEQGALL